MRQSLLFLFASLFLFAACDTKTNSSSCGDGVIDLNEECDSDQLGQYQSCSEFGLHGGELTCSSDCTWDTSGCGVDGSCGDGTIQGGYEECEEGNLDGETCETLGHEGGTLACNESCQFDRSQCEGESLCGNGLMNPGEECDGEDFGGYSREAHGGYEGSLACSSSCRIDYTDCAYCGNDIVEVAHGEECDSTQIQDCIARDEGFGVPLCTDCQYDDSPCQKTHMFGSLIDDIVWTGAMDQNEDLYLAGVSLGGWGGLTGQDWIQYLTKVNHMGENEWTVPLRVSTGSGTLPPWGVVPTDEGNIVVLGTLYPEGGPSGSYIQIYDTDGAELVRTTDSIANGAPWWMALAKGESNTLWRAGVSFSDYSLVLEQLTSEATSLDTISVETDGLAMPVGIFPLDSGGLIVYGNTTGSIAQTSYVAPNACYYNSSETDSHVCSAPFVMGVSSTGEVEWTVIHDGSSPNELTITGGQLTDSGEIVLCGETNFGDYDGETSYGKKDIACLWYDLTGNHVQTKVYGSAADDLFGGITLAADGSLVLAASSRDGLFGLSPNLSFDIYITTLNSAGQTGASVSVNSDSVDKSRLLIAFPEREELFMVGTTTGTWESVAPSGGEDVLIHHLAIPGQ